MAFTCRPRPLSSDVLWPTPGFPYDRRELNSAVRAHECKVSFLARPRTHSPGQERPFVVATRE